MKQIDFNTSTSRNEETLQLIDALKVHPQIRLCIERGDFDEGCVERYPWKISEWLKQLEPCIRCKSLSFCKQASDGYFIALRYDGMLKQVSVPCKYKRKEMEKEAHLSKFLVNDMAKKLNAVSFEDTDVAEESDAYLDVFMAAMNCSSENKSFYLHGTMGSGKTYLSACACNAHARKGESVAFVHVPTFMSRMASTMKSGEYREEVKKLTYAKFVVFDDIGAESVTEWNRDSILLPILNARYENGLATWFTSNYDLSLLEDHFSFSSKGKEEKLKASRIMERIEAMCTVKTLTSADRRKKASYAG